MLYKQLHIDTIKLGARAQIEHDFGEGAILIPNDKAKIFVHWITDKGNVRSTWTMTYASKITGKVRLINGLDNDLSIQVLTDW